MTDRDALKEIAFGWHTAKSARIIAAAQLDTSDAGIPAVGETDNRLIFTAANIARARKALYENWLSMSIATLAKRRRYCPEYMP